MVRFCINELLEEAKDNVEKEHYLHNHVQHKLIGVQWWSECCVVSIRKDIVYRAHNQEHIKDSFPRLTHIDHVMVEQNKVSVDPGILLGRLLVLAMWA